jgi:hypothetical protein
MPLQNCDRPERCNCRYERYGDRRGGPRRKAEGALPTNEQAVDSGDSRQSQGRRNDELDASGAAIPWFRNRSD